MNHAATGARHGDADARFQRLARLTKPAEFRRVFSGAIKSSDRYFSVRACPSNGASGRLGLAIAKKCAPKAIDRNRLKRIVRETFRASRHTLTGLEIVVMCRRDAVDAPNRTLAESLARHWDAIRDQLCASC